MENIFTLERAQEMENEITDKIDALFENKLHLVEMTYQETLLNNQASGEKIELLGKEIARLDGKIERFRGQQKMIGDIIIQLQGNA